MSTPPGTSERSRSDEAPRRRNRNSTPAVQLNLNVRGLGESATLHINEVSAQLAAEGRDVYRMGLGQSPFPVPQPVVEELRVNAHQKDYLPVRGLRALREAVAQYHRRQESHSYTADDVLIGPGSKELMFLVQLVYYGDLVIPTPSWVSYAPQAHILGRQIRWVPTGPEQDWRLLPERFDELCRDDAERPRLVILNYPSNPTGDTYTVDELKEIARIARKYRVVLISDEIYGELHHRGQHVSVARFYPEGTIISSGLSKWCGAGGWRLGTFTFPRELRWLLDAMSVVASETFTATSAPIQFAAVRAFAGGIEIERYLWNSRRLLRALGRHCWRELKRAGVNVTAPQGGFYLFPDFSPLKARLAARGITTSDQMCTTLLDDTGVAILPGTAFGRPPEEFTARIAYVDFDGARALTAADHMDGGKGIDKAFLELYCGRVVRAIELIAEWSARD